MATRSAVIFDFDGTLTKPCLDFDVIRTEIGIDDARPILEAMAQMDDADRQAAERVLLRYEWEAARTAELQEGAGEVLAACRASGYPVAILTRNGRATLDFVLTSHGIEIDAIRTREDGAIKPSPEPVISLCDELQADPLSSWIVGDHLFDIRSGNAAGLRTVLLVDDKPIPEYAAEANHVIRRLGELLPLVKAER